MLTLKSGFPSPWPWPSKHRISRNVLSRDSCREWSSHSKGYFDLNSLLWTSHQSEMQRHVQLLPIHIISPMFQKFEIVELPGRAPQNCWEPNFHTHNCQWVFAFCKGFVRPWAIVIMSFVSHLFQFVPEKLQNNTPKESGHYIIFYLGGCIKAV